MTSERARLFIVVPVPAAVRAEAIAEGVSAACVGARQHELQLSGLGTFGGRASGGKGALVL